MSTITKAITITNGTNSLQINNKNDVINLILTNNALGSRQTFSIASTDLKELKDFIENLLDQKDISTIPAEILEKAS